MRASTASTSSSSAARCSSNSSTSHSCDRSASSSSRDRAFAAASSASASRSAAWSRSSNASSAAASASSCVAIHRTAQPLCARTMHMRAPVINHQAAPAASRARTRRQARRRLAPLAARQAAFHTRRSPARPARSAAPQQRRERGVNATRKPRQTRLLLQLFAESGSALAAQRVVHRSLVGRHVPNLSRRLEAACGKAVSSVERPLRRRNRARTWLPVPLLLPTAFAAPQQERRAAKGAAVRHASA